MKPLLIIKTGSTVSRVPAELGDFEDWITLEMGLQPAQVLVSKVFDGEELPAPDTVSGVVITGSPAMVTAGLDWSEYSAQWLRSAVPDGLPILGVCYGHQLLAHALGGVVDFHPAGREIGTVMISQTDAAAQDLLFGNLPAEYPAHVTHMQSVMRLPPGAVILGSNAHEAHHAVRFAPKVWGVQFHPEFNARVMCAYLDEREADLLAEGYDMSMLRDAVRDTPEMRQLMQGFCRLLTD